MFLLPTHSEVHAGSWEVVKENKVFVLQKAKQQESVIWKAVVATIQNVNLNGGSRFDSKQPPFRIVLKSPQNPGSLETGHVVAVAESLKIIQKGLAVDRR
ncbi:hypothetical protein HDU77_000213 [Chytriomyces hyalinus]|nr:hypothetical protein HDU77_000213 [Chytriomyces hyalinus]